MVLQDVFKCVCKCWEQNSRPVIWMQKMLERLEQKVQSISKHSHSLISLSLSLLFAAACAPDAWDVKVSHQSRKKHSGCLQPFTAFGAFQIFVICAKNLSRKFAASGFQRRPYNP